MTSFGARIWLIVCAVVAAVLQIVVAPSIHIMTAAPNFILCYVVAVGVANARGVGYIIPFVLGLAYDLIGEGPVGAMAFTCVAAAFLASLLFRLFDNETIFIPIAVVVFVCLASEIVYGLLTVACGLDVDLLEALLTVVLPCAAYDIVLATIMYLLLRQFVFRDKGPNTMTIIDTKIDQV